MRSPPWLISRTWMLVPIGGVAFMLWTNSIRIRHIVFISTIAEENATVDPASPTGYPGGVRQMIPPDRNIESQQWIMQTQQMLAERRWRVRHVDTDNAPFGREAGAVSVYRWWLGSLAWLDHKLSGQPIGLSVERAALYSDPVLHLLLLLAATVFVACRFGTLPAALMAAGMAVLFPWAGGFQPGVPTSHGLASACALWSLLLIADGIRLLPTPGNDTIRAARRAFFASGLVDGLGLWIQPASQLLMVGGIAIGGAVMVWVRHRHLENTPGGEEGAAPWRAWSAGGAIACVAAWTLEYIPDHIELTRFDAIHPLYAIGWLGLGELLVRAETRSRHGRWFESRWAIGGATLAAIAVVASAITAAFSPDAGPFDGNPLAWKLTNLPDSPVARHLLEWLARDGIDATGWATFLPMLVLVPAILILVQGRISGGRCLGIAFLLGPALVALGLAGFQLRAWNLVDAVLLVLLVVSATPKVGTTANQAVRWAWAVAATLVLAPGIRLLVLPAGAAEPDELNTHETPTLVERDLAHWLADRADPGGAVVFAPPWLSTSLAYYGGLRGIGTPFPENDAGMRAAIRIASSTSADETLALLRQREVTHVVLPSWDPGLDELARLGSGSRQGTFISGLNHWALPPWMRPLPYQPPRIPGWSLQSAIVFARVDEQEEVDAVSRIAEYFLEDNQVERASAFREALRGFPASLGALAALAQIEMARSDVAAFTQIFDTVVAYTTGGADRSLPWDRRVSLAIVLAQGKRRELAEKQLQRCLVTMSEDNLRALTPSSLYRFQLLLKMFGLEIADPELRDLARLLIPAELRERV